MCGSISSRSQIRFCHHLDPRPAEAARTRPYADAVNIPLTELAERTHELPPRHEVVSVIGTDDVVHAAIQWLESHGRRARPAEGAPSAADQADQILGQLWRPNAFLVGIAPQLPAGRALDLGCGVGREAVYLANLGWDVTAVDILPDALTRGQDLSRRYCTTAAPIRWLAADVEHDDPTAGVRFELITIFRYLPRQRLAALHEWIKPGGSLVLETFTTTHRARHGRPGRDEDVSRPGELATLLSGWHMRTCLEDWQGHEHTTRVWAVWPA